MIRKTIYPNIEVTKIDKEIIKATNLKPNLQSSESEDNKLKNVHISKKEPDNMEENNKKFFNTLFIIQIFFDFITRKEIIFKRPHIK